MNIKNTLKSLSAFEKGLWLTSVGAVFISMIFSPSVDILSLTASLIGVTALIFVAKGNALGQLLTIVFAVLYAIASYQQRYYGEMITYAGMTAPIALVSLVTWLKHPFSSDGGEVRVANTTAKKVLLGAVLTALVTAAFYFILKALGNASLALSTVSVATSFSAAYLTVIRSPWYAAAYAANDIVLIGLWVIVCLDDIRCLSMAVCFAVFLINDIYGFFNWKRIRRRQIRENEKSA
ncbi:MAG: nicotinamide riboside transporter PnuC [Acutalibacteraceae bacterium]